MTADKVGSYAWLMRERRDIMDNILFYNDLIEKLTESRNKSGHSAKTLEAYDGAIADNNAIRAEYRKDLKQLRDDWGDYVKRYE